MTCLLAWQVEMSNRHQVKLVQSWLERSGVGIIRTQSRWDPRRREGGGSTISYHTEYRHKEPDSTFRIVCGDHQPFRGKDNAKGRNIKSQNWDKVGTQLEFDQVLCACPTPSCPGNRSPSPRNKETTSKGRKQKSESQPLQSGWLLLWQGFERSHWSRQWTKPCRKQSAYD